ncbi:hypothetical protein BJ742DRAFT_112985 [Cladochytrium replicatum]|nr:hypothetical protein BJ742DRAFT_112985 [Cladochytrium replicatum]
MYPLVARVERSLARLTDPAKPLKGDGYAISTTFATVSPAMWEDFLTIDRYIVRAVMALCHALWLNPDLGSHAHRDGVQFTSLRSRSRLWLSMVVDYGMRLGLHQNFRPPGDRGFDEIEDQNLSNQIDERRMLWWSLFILERSYFPLDEPAVKLTKGMNLSTGTTLNKSPAVPFSVLISSINVVPDFDPNSITPVPLSALGGSLINQSHRKTIQEQLYILCLQDPKCVKVCERLRTWQLSGLITLHVLALGAHLARQRGYRQGEWWTVETQSEVELSSARKQIGCSVAYEESLSDLEDFDDVEIKSIIRDDRWDFGLDGALRLAQLRKMVRQIETVFAYNEHWQEKQGKNTNPQNFASATFPTFFWDTTVQKRSLGPTPLISLPAILSIVHSPSHILENLAQNHLMYSKRGVRNLSRDDQMYEMLVRWARSRYGGQLCWVQTQTLMRRMAGLTQYVVWSQLHEQFYHSPLGRFDAYNLQTDCPDEWCSACPKEQGAQIRSINRSLMLNAQMASIIWRAVAMAVVLWGLWEELGETKSAIYSSTREHSGSADESSNAEAVDIDETRSELISSVEVVLKWITSTLTFCKSNTVYQELLTIIRDAIF